MKVHTSIFEFEGNRPLVVTQGTYDGVHLGHRKILEKIVQFAKTNDCESALLTFWPHPRTILNPLDKGLELLQTIEEKIEEVAKIGVDHFIIIPFTNAIAKSTPKEFIEDIILKNLNLHSFIIGYDHRFGNNRSAGFEELKNFGVEYKFEVAQIAAEDIADCTVSSTKIRNALKQGDVRFANQLLGRNYSISGTIIHGKNQGTLLGFPTANMSVAFSQKLIPKNGVYAVYVFIDKIRYSGMLNIGVNPTFGNNEKTIEIHIFDYSSDLYHHFITISFVERLRDEYKFESKELLVLQLRKDEESARKILA